MFSLKKYLNQKNVLNEKLLSTVLSNLLNEPSDFFKTYINTESKESARNNIRTKFDVIKNKYAEIRIYQNKIFGSGSIYSYMHWNKNTKLDDTTYKITNLKYFSDYDEIKKIHETYNKLVQDFIKLLLSTFSHPHPEVFSALASRRVDLFNIMDHNFSKPYYASDLKLYKSKEQKSKYIDDHKLNTHLAFWFRHDGTLLCVTKGQIIYAYSPVIGNINREELYAFRLSSFSNPKEELNKMLNNIVNLTIKYDPLIENLPELDFPIITEERHRGLSILEFIKKYCSSSASFYNAKSKSMGLIFSKACTLRKNTDWGSHPDDYFIVYSPTLDLNIEGIEQPRQYKRYVDSHGETVGYNEYKSSDANPFKQAKQSNYHSSSTYNRYIWLKQLNGIFKRYGITREDSIRRFGFKLEEYHFDSIYETDMYCKRLAKANFNRYRYEAERIKAEREINGIKDISDIIDKVLKHLTYKDSYTNILQLLYSNNSEALKDFLNIYGTYMAMINKCILDITIINTNKDTISKITSGKHEYLVPGSRSSKSEIEQNKKVILETYDLLENDVKCIEDTYDLITKFIEENKSN